MNPPSFPLARPSLAAVFLVLLPVLWSCEGGTTGLDEKRFGPEGGTATLAEGSVILSVPPGALMTEVWFTAAPTTLIPTSELNVPGTAYEIGPPGTKLSRPGFLTISYDPASIPAGIGEEGLGLFQVIENEWHPLANASVDTTSRTVSGEISTLTRVGIVGFPVASVEVSPTSSEMAPGTSLQFQAALQATNGRSMSDRAVTWSSSTSTVATVDASGRVEAVAEGTVTITASSGGESGTASVTVALPVASVEVTPNSGAVDVGQTLQLTASAKDASGTELPGRTVDWASSNNSVATVDSDGLVTGLTLGSTAITATMGGRSSTATVTVHSSLTVVNSSLADGVVGSAYAQTLAATGGNGSYTWQVSGGDLPNGMSLSSSSGTISGTPSTEGISTFTVRVASAGGTAERGLSITVSPVPVASVEVTPPLASVIPGGTLQLTATALDASGSVISGRTILWASTDTSVASVSSAGLVTGVAEGFGMIAASVGGQSDWSAVTVHTKLGISKDTLASGVVGSEYTHRLSVHGGDGRNIWSVLEGVLPTGLTLNDSSGVILGTPTVADSSTFTVQVTSGDGQAADEEFSIIIHGVLEITTETLMAGMIGNAYSDTLESVGGAGSRTWSVEEGAFPAGLSLNESTGAISGTPTADGAASFIIKVVSEDEQEANRALSLNVTPVPVASVVVTPATANLTPGQSVFLTATPRNASGNALTGRTVTWQSSNLSVATVESNGLATGNIVGSVTVTATAEGQSGTATITVHGVLSVSTSSLADGAVGATYSQTLAATGGNGSYTWSIAPGSLPAGLVMAPATGLITGTPSAVGAFNFIVQVTSGDGQTTTKDLSITVAASLP